MTSEDLTLPAPNDPGDSRHLGNVLIAEDDPLYRRALQQLLTSKGYDVLLVSDGTHALELARSAEAPRLLILDWIMPGIHGPEICRSVRDHSAERYQYILLLTAKHTPDDIVEGLEAGADDYLVKPFNAHELLARVRVGERMLKLHDRLLAAQESLRFQATHDSLTGIWNRSALFELLNAEFQRAGRKSTSFSLFLVDIDSFKRVNDKYGHLAGDAILREVAHRLNAAIRPYDFLGRYGGEEFIVAASELNSAAARQFAERLRAAVSSSPIDAGSDVTVTVSVGAATSRAPLDSSVQNMIQSADAAMYRAKHNGGNRAEATELT